MSTRSHIRIKEEGRDFRLYHHFDGYPEGVGTDLKRYLNRYNKNCYGGERSHWDGDDIANDLVKGKFPINDDGYEITTDIHGDEEYVYVIDCENKTLTCYAMDWDETFDQVVKANRVEEIPDPEPEDTSETQNPA